jgi:hypothetical protein
MMSIMTVVAQMTSQKSYMSLSLFVLIRPNFLLALPCSRFKRIGKEKLSSHLMLLSVIRYLCQNIKLSHTIPPIEELKRLAYCKWHGKFSHATNDCNVFRQQIQLSINESHLSF